MKKITALFLMVCAASLFSVEIVKDNKAETCIVIDEKAPDTVKYAAKELSSYINKIYGAKLEITSKPDASYKNYIYVGPSKYTTEKGLDVSGLKYDGFKIISGANWIAILGRDYKSKKIMHGFCHSQRPAECYNKKLKLNRFGETGTLFGVYCFLEKFCDTRWYMPDPLGEVLPEKRKDLNVKSVDISKAPDSEYRYIYDCDFPKDDETAIWDKRIGFGAPYPVPLNHSFKWMFLDYRKSEPKLFALVDGKRDINITCQGDGNLCLSNKRVLEIAVQKAKEYFKKNPNQKIFPVMPNDGLFRICDCPECQKQAQNELGMDGKFSYYVWNFVNKVAKELYKTHPDKYIGCLAYSTHKTPPEGIEFSPNVICMICKSRHKYWNPEYKKTNELFLKEWSSKVKNIYIWEYYNWAPHQAQIPNVPVFFPHILSEDIKSLKGISKGEFIEAETWERNQKEILHMKGINHLNHYLSIKLLWDNDADIDCLLSEYYEKFYGPAAKEMKEFWDYAEKIWTRDTSKSPYDGVAHSDTDKRTTQVFEYLYTYEEVEKFLKILDKAIEKTPKDSVYRKRIELIKSEILPLLKRVKTLTSLPSYDAKYTSSQPEINGEENDECWKKSKAVKFTDVFGNKSKSGTYVQMCWDKENLYLFFKCYLEKGEKIVAQASGKDSMGRPFIWNDDSIEIFLNPWVMSEKKYYQIIINSNGATWDALHDKTQKKENIEIPMKWNADSKFKVKKYQDHWNMEIALPWKNISIDDALKTKYLRANFFRNFQSAKKKKSECWSPICKSNFHTVSRFGKIILDKSETTVSGGK